MFEKFNFHVTTKTEEYKGQRYAAGVVLYKQGGCHTASDEEKVMWRALQKARLI